jgi:toxin-antitoxin system PIN domain toxin
MTYLLDVNVLIALCDVNHAHHISVNRWFAREGYRSWATCPLTENAFVRITSRRSYPRSTGSVSDQIHTLSELCHLRGHQFWPDDVSLLDSDSWSSHVGVKADDLTDLYLVALAAKRKGRFASLDRSIVAQRMRQGTAALDLLSPENT